MALSHCRLVLHVNISHIQLADNEEAWPNVFRALGSLPLLHQLSLSVLRDQSFRTGRLAFSGLEHGTTCHDGRAVGFEGKEQIAGGLSELEDTLLSKIDDDDTPFPYIIFDRETDCRICLHDTE